MDPNNHARAERYRQLALAEPDMAKAAILIKIAEEAEQDLLCTVDWMRNAVPRSQSKPPNLA